MTRPSTIEFLPFFITIVAPLGMAAWSGGVKGLLFTGFMEVCFMIYLACLAVEDLGKTIRDLDDRRERH